MRTTATPEQQSILPSSPAGTGMSRIFRASCRVVEKAGHRQIGARPRGRSAPAFARGRGPEICLASFALSPVAGLDA